MFRLQTYPVVLVNTDTFRCLVDPVTYSVVIIPGKLCYFVLGYHQYFPMTKAVLRRTGLFHFRVLAAAVSVSACHIDFLRNRQHCVLLRKCYIRGAMLPPIVV
jgi:hypothetical protein